MAGHPKSGFLVYLRKINSTIFISQKRPADGSF
jgi:hypothetical protein